MYLDNSSVEEASGVYPIDDDDYTSASGSGKASCIHTHLCSLCLCMHVHTHTPTLTHTYTHTLLECASGKQAGGITVKGALCGVTVPGCEFQLSAT